jgi:hypothetical protein
MSVDKSFASMFFQQRIGKGEDADYLDLRNAATSSTDSLFEFILPC